MRLIKKPELTHEEILKSCISNIDRKDLKDNILAELEFFNKSSEEYEKKAVSGRLSEISTHTDVNNKISKEEMKFLYGKLLTKGIPARDYYEKILHGSKMCPFCGYRPAKTLEHYLPKSKFPTYAVDPLNLIPCCRDCNSIKLAHVQAEMEETLHPYYDNVDGDQWLFAEIEEVREIGFKFYTKKPSNWSEKLYQKVNYHFLSFELSNIYSIYASSELSDQAYTLKSLYDLGGPQVVRSRLFEFQTSAQKPYLNSWKSAMFEALANNVWFCSSGIKDYPI